VIVGSTTREFVLVFESAVSRQEHELLVTLCVSVCLRRTACVWPRVRVRGKCAPCVASSCKLV
jgi:hypothetical protein